jgi:hypothetical protein
MDKLRKYEKTLEQLDVTNWEEHTQNRESWRNIVTVAEDLEEPKKQKKRR